MKFENLENGEIIEVKINDFTTIERFKGFPDKFKVIEEFEIKSEESKEKTSKKK